MWTITSTNLLTITSTLYHVDIIVNKGLFGGGWRGEEQDREKVPPQGHELYISSLAWMLYFHRREGSGGVAVWHRKREMVVEIYNDGPSNNIYIQNWLQEARRAGGCSNARCSFLALRILRCPSPYPACIATSCPYHPGCVLMHVNPDVVSLILLWHFLDSFFHELFF